MGLKRAEETREERKRKLLEERRRKGVWFTEQSTGKKLEFSIYEEKELDLVRRGGLSGKIIEQEMDDDCMTDEELCRNAQRKLKERVREAVADFLENPRKTVKNLAF